MCVQVKDRSQGCTPEVASLPSWEICIYWLLSFGSHLYSFKELHRFSKEYEEGLMREFEFEKGFLIWGFKKDPTDFEWSFWNEWARKSLIWSLLGHVLVSKLAGFFAPKGRAAVLTLYGLLAAWCLLGGRGLAMVGLHMSVSFGVALLKRPCLCWLCSLLLLSTLLFGSLEDMQRSWYRTENEYYLLVFSLAISCLRYISFSLDYCWQDSEENSLDSFFWLSAYVFYHPLFTNGPIMNFGDVSNVGNSYLINCCADNFVHVLQNNKTNTDYLWNNTLVHNTLIHIWLQMEQQIPCVRIPGLMTDSESEWKICGLALAQVLFFYVKYLVLFGVPSLVVRLDGIESPKLPRCVSTMYSFTGMWRHFDVGLYRWLVRYIYVPLGGSHNGVVQKTVSTALVFGFVCYWHGGHDYLVIWALLNWMGVIAENGVKAFLSLPPVYTFFWDKALWTDETKINSYQSNRKAKVWRKIGTANDPKNTTSNSEIHKRIFSANIRKTGTRLIGLQFIMQQDNNPKHTAHLTQEFIRQKKCSITNWPSPDLNPIEHAFHLLKSSLEAESPASKQQLKEAAVKAWQSISSEETRVW
ncbi:HHAT palmitoyltransferase, partial [Atractosteus spatula]|nr:HHAT palmitoyltransferase [Atractosteus spatula]